jgi:hypothetical protein
MISCAKGRSNLTAFKSSNFHDFLCKEGSILTAFKSSKTFMIFLCQRKSDLTVFKSSNFHDFFVQKKHLILQTSNLQTFMNLFAYEKGSDITVFKSEVLPIIFHDGYCKVWKSFKIDKAYYTNQSLLSRGDKIKQVAHHRNNLHLPQVQTKS